MENSKPQLPAAEEKSVLTTPENQLEKSGRTAAKQPQPQQNGDADRADFESLIQGRFKEAFAERVQKIIDGPEEDNAFSVVGSTTRLLSLIEKDGICYVNFDSAFLNYESPVLPEITLYAIVNSLCDTGRVNKVQFMVEGNSDIVFRDKMSLNHLYERNLDIVE